MPAHKGSKHHLAILSEDTVRTARQRFRREGASARQLAEEYGVTPGAMRRALTGTTWKHLGDPEQEGDSRAA